MCLISWFSRKKKRIILRPKPFSLKIIKKWIFEKKKKYLIKESKIGLTGSGEETTTKLPAKFHIFKMT